MSIQHAERVQVKLYASGHEALKVQDLIPVFHEWIREDRLSALSEFVIDVADYSHVPNGPGVVLIGHASDYYYDQSQGRPGLMYSRKRDHEGDLGARLKDALHRTAFACQRLQKDTPLSFSATELLIKVPDRLHVKNNDKGYSAFIDHVGETLKSTVGDFEATREGDPRAPLTVRISAPTATVESILKAASN